MGCNLIQTLRPCCADTEFVGSIFAYQKVSPYPVPHILNTAGVGMYIYIIVIHADIKVPTATIEVPVSA